MDLIGLKGLPARFKKGYMLTFSLKLSEDL
jgi:hypothetical protein